MAQHGAQNTDILVAVWRVKLWNTLLKNNMNMEYGMWHRHVGAIQMLQCFMFNIFSTLAIFANGN